MEGCEVEHWTERNVFPRKSRDDEVGIESCLNRGSDYDVRLDLG